MSPASALCFILGGLTLVVGSLCLAFVPAREGWLGNHRAATVGAATMGLFHLELVGVPLLSSSSLGQGEQVWGILLLNFPITLLLGLMRSALEVGGTSLDLAAHVPGGLVVYMGVGWGVASGIRRLTARLRRGGTEGPAQ